ncbi:ribokinase [Ameyamaea chiangmaiensis NBRC 103196]|uniref:Ribokinase n=1 Tax=Ameyamaea chiangmaiensis TaxID=442969 RepID=A0A850P3L7_9PROT|nr:ribokinase [Ameyamaea chiangmaiensis]MBS4074479.1 ribokinase [Ameyamaea chiangmaiensis]NVN39257.1 ribokinase [Ameyamaea chiangmaiensis]GBQ72184.1 ribokinase [Ameyamaea chiangmaiensis NBRC 103196]
MSDTSLLLPAIVIFGSINIDIVARLEALPKPGETLHAPAAQIGLGGKGANQAAAAARLSGSARLVGQVGNDAFADTARTALARFGVDASALRTDRDHQTGLALIAVDARGENTITVIGGANLSIAPTDLPEFEKVLFPAKVLLLQLEIPLAVVRTAAQAAHTRGVPVILDPAPVPHEPLDPALYALATVMTPNETETERLVGIRPHDAQTAADAAAVFHQRGLARVLIKLGARGVFWSADGESGFIPPFRVTAIDSVAAGDCFNGGLATAMAEGRPFADCVRFAAACGALATTRHGAADAAPTRDEVDELLRSQP